MIRKSTTPELRTAFESHLQETKTQDQRLEQVFELDGTEPQSVDCPAIDGIIEEAEEVAGEVADKTVLEAALIAAGQSVEHYEIACYGALIAWAKELGKDDCAQRLAETLAEDVAADKKLTATAEQGVNRAAA